ncbi:MAG: aldo/keto reductase [Gammaproteobacteria bacterium]|nr:aldo/keto reductase [Gammaproteobacteria bacterium]
MDLKKRLLGNTLVEVSELGFGGAPIGAVGSRITDELAESIVESAWNGGIRYFDTAPLYGHGLSEKRLGHSLSSYPREEFALSTKIGRLLVSRDRGTRFQGMLDDEPVAIQYDYSGDAVRKSIESSLERLGLDRVDILLCHDIDAWTHGDDQPQIYEAAAKGALPALHRLREEGVVQAIGLGVNESAVCSRVMREFDPNCFLLAGRFTLLEQEPLDEMLPLCLAKNVSVVIGGPYNSGLLANAERRRATYDYKPAPDDLWDKAQSIRRVCDSHSVDMRAAALQYPLRHEAVASVIPGMWSLEEVAMNLSFVQEDIPDSLWSDLAAEGLSRSW